MRDLATADKMQDMRNNRQLNCARRPGQTLSGLHYVQRRNPGYTRASCYAGGRQDDFLGIAGRHSDVVSTSASALPHSQAARDSESFHHEQAPRRSFTSYDEDERIFALKAKNSSVQNLRFKTIMLKVSGEALQVRCNVTMPRNNAVNLRRISVYNVTV